MAIIRNPTAGRGAGETAWPTIQRLLEPYRSQWEFLESTTTPGATSALARKAAQEAEVVVACGGDGTIMQVASALVGTEAVLGLLPVGTGNDFCRCVKLGTDLELSVRTLFEGETREIDVGRWQCEGKEGVFINVSGSGFDAVVAGRINAGYRFLRGRAAYVAAVGESLLKFRPANFRICVDDEVCETSVTLCAVANATSYGGGMLVSPNSRLDDGALDVVIVQGVGAVEFLRAFPTVFRGEHIDHPKVRVMRGKHVTIESDRPMPVLADGESIGKTPVTFEVEPAALRILVPKTLA